MTAANAALADRTRARLADLIDRQMEPLGLAAMDRLGPIAGARVLDIGCGAGATVLQLAERVGAAGQVVGVDIGPAVLAVARARTQGCATIELIEGDAGDLSFPPASFDAVYSRFGVMFFADPVPAFRNLRRLLRPGGRLAFVCWRPIRENELDRAPLAAAGYEPKGAAHLSFERRATIQDVLAAADFERIAIEPVDRTVSCGGVEATLEVATHVGALGKLLRETPALRGTVEVRVREALDERARDGVVALQAATWVVTAERVA